MNKNQLQSNHKQTPIGKIPAAWEVVKLSDIGEIVTGTTPSTKIEEYWKNGTINWFTPTDLSKLDNNIYITESSRKITEKSVKESGLTIMPKGSIIISTRAPVGYVAILKQESTINQGCKGLIPNDWSQVSAEFYGYYLLYKERKLQNMSSGSTFKELSKDRLKNLEIPLPPIPEQNKIAEILFTVDEAIEKINQKIEKTKRLKKGLMQELLTKGIGHKEFKDTEIGRIPKEWGIMEIGDITEEVYRYPTYYNIKYSKDGVPEIRGELINANGDLESDITKYRFIPRETSEKYNRTIMKEGDFVISVRGTMGKIGIVPKNLEGSNITANLMRLSFNRAKCFPSFIKQILISNLFQNRLNNVSSHTTIKTIQSPILKSMKFQLPSLLEQQKIAEILSAVDKKLESEKRRKEKLERIKKGLMEVLLTGKKRVLQAE